jgi:uncharacterized phage protein (TIGR01671 family)
MREIKFRAWSSNDNKMYYEIFRSSNGAKKSCGCFENLPIGLNHFLKSSSKGYSLMQFTGLTDKNGKEIWEGDVVRYGRDGLNQGQGKVIMQANWYWTIEGFYNTSFDWPACAFSEDQDTEVLGNIYENPSLLTV